MIELNGAQPLYSIHSIQLFYFLSEGQKQFQITHVVLIQK